MPIEHNINGTMRFRCAICRWSFSEERRAERCEDLHLQNEARRAINRFVEQEVNNVDFSE